MQAQGITDSIHVGSHTKALVWTLISIALLGNVLTLFVPFIHFKQALSSTVAFTLFGTVEEMWTHGLWVLAIIIVFFSVIFPFAKIGVIAYSLIQGPGTRRQGWLHLVERLGKWSMIDVFIVCFILALTKDQFFVGTKPKIGLYTFMGAIILSLAAGSILTSEWSRPGRQTARCVTVPPTLLTAILLALASISLIAVMCFPVMAIDDWLLANHEFNVLNFLWALLQQGAAPVALTIAAGLVALPVLDLALRWRLWWRGRRQGVMQQSRLLDILPNWTLMDVFLVSLIIFLFEGDKLMSVTRGPGTWFLLLFAACYVIRGVTLRAARPATDSSSLKTPVPADAPESRPEPRHTADRR